VAVIGAILILGFAIYPVILGEVTVFDFWKYIVVLCITSGISLLVWGWKPEIEAYIKGKNEVIIQKDSLRFYKYPYLLISEQRQQQRMPNMAYATITVENIGKIKAKECEIEIQLINKGEPYSSKVLSSLSVDSQGQPNPRMVSIDGNHGTMGFHPLALNLETLQALLPNHSLGVAGKFTGTLVRHDQYEIFGKVIYDEKQSEIIPLGKIKIPDDLLTKSIIPNDIQILLDQGGFAVYLERYQNKIRAKFYGQYRDEELIRLILNDLIKFPQIDIKFEDNGKLRHWETIDGVLHLSDVK